MFNLTSEHASKVLEHAKTVIYWLYFLYIKKTVLITLFYENSVLQKSHFVGKTWIKFYNVRKYVGKKDKNKQQINAPETDNLFCSYCSNDYLRETNITKHCLLVSCNLNLKMCKLG